MTNTTNNYLDADQINSILNELGINTKPYEALWAYEEDGETMLADYNTALPANFRNAEECIAYAKGWTDAVGYFEDKD